MSALTNAQVLAEPGPTATETSRPRRLAVVPPLPATHQARAASRPDSPGVATVLGLSAQADRPYFAHAQGLRRLLLHAYADDGGGWHTHPDVPALMEYIGDKYALLARRYGQTAEDAVFAAFEVLALPSTLDFDDPWGVVTRAVQLTLQAEDRAQRLLCSPDDARRLMHSDDHDAARFSDYDDAGGVPHVVEQAIAAHCTTTAQTAQAPSSGLELCGADVANGEVTVRLLLRVAGWPPDAARVGLDYVCERVRIAGSPTRAYEYLRRDGSCETLLGISPRSWNALCRALLGDAGRPGLIARAILGERPAELLADRQLVRALADAAPAVRHG